MREQHIHTYILIYSIYIHINAQNTQIHSDGSLAFVHHHHHHHRIIKSSNHRIIESSSSSPPSSSPSSPSPSPSASASASSPSSSPSSPSPSSPSSWSQPCWLYVPCVSRPTCGHRFPESSRNRNLSIQLPKAVLLLVILAAVKPRVKPCQAVLGHQNMGWHQSLGTPNLGPRTSLRGLWLETRLIIFAFLLRKLSPQKTGWSPCLNPRCFHGHVDGFLRSMSLSSPNWMGQGHVRAPTVPTGPMLNEAPTTTIEP